MRINEIVGGFSPVGKDAATVVVRVQAGGGVEAGGARRAENNARAAAASEDVHGAKSASVHDPAARNVVDVFVDAKAPCEFSP